MSDNTDSNAELDAQQSGIIISYNISQGEAVADSLTNIWSLLESAFDHPDNPSIILMITVDGHQTDTDQPAEDLTQLVTEFLVPIAAGICDEIQIRSPVDRHLDCATVSLADTAQIETDRTDQLDDTGIEDGHTAAQFVTQNTPLAAYDPETESLAYAFLSTDTYTELIEHGDLTESQLLDDLVLDGQ
jgi:hypothetical protein